MKELRNMQIQDEKGNVYHPETSTEQVRGLKSMIEDAQPVIVRDFAPVKEHEAYPVGQLWYDNSSGGLFIYKGEGSDGTGRWSLLIQDSELERYRDSELKRYHELLNRINAIENTLFY